MRSSRKRGRDVDCPVQPHGSDVKRRVHYPTGSDENNLEQLCVAKWCSSEWKCSDLTTLEHLVTKAGGRGIEHLALDPAKKGRNASRRVQHALDVEAQALRPHLYFVDTPVHDKSSNQRVYARLPMRLAHEALASLH